MKEFYLKEFLKNVSKGFKNNYNFWDFEKFIT
jgi:hypothetical protein